MSVYEELTSQSLKSFICANIFSNQYLFFNVTEYTLWSPSLPAALFSALINLYASYVQSATEII